MNKQEIELKKERNFSEVFNASFEFITQELKMFSRVIGLYAGVPIVIAVIMNAYFTQDTFTSILRMVQGNNMENPSTSMGLIFLTMFFAVLAQLFINGLVPAYFGEYEEKGKGNFSSVDVWKRFIRNFGAIIGYSIVVGIILVFGLVFFIIPGIYLFVPLSLVLYVKIIEGKEFGETISRCFKLIRRRWWITFGIMIIAYVIVSIVSTLFSFPAMIVAGIEGFLVGGGHQDAESSKSLVFILTTIVGSLGQYLIYPALYVIIAFQYYNLREQKDREVLMSKVSAINPDA
ncbi:hypothetical protein ACT29H_06775 [Thermophagus sp. OGC60D27]|uniref:hypothetical protein n=1 Tax=Thermophagus sp. OGC60D27 TaxID=3458415 RepID=UPI0040376327